MGCTPHPGAERPAGGLYGGLFGPSEASEAHRGQWFHRSGAYPLSGNSPPSPPLWGRRGWFPLRRPHSPSEGLGGDSGRSIPLGVRGRQNGSVWLSADRTYVPRWWASESNVCSMLHGSGVSPLSGNPNVCSISGPPPPTLAAAHAHARPRTHARPYARTRRGAPVPIKRL